MTSVISVRGRNKDYLLLDPNFVYVGRRCAGWPDSIWGNPWRVGKPGGRRSSRFQPKSECYVSTAEEAVERFERHLRNAMEHPPAIVVDPFGRMASCLPLLRGKKLGCWCCDWKSSDVQPAKPCHAIVLAKLADSLPLN